MNEQPHEKVLRADGSFLPRDPVVEVPVLLESRLLPLLAIAASDQGMSAGTLVRCLIRDFLDGAEGVPLSPAEIAEPPRPEDALL